METIKREIFTQTESLFKTQKLFQEEKERLCSFLHQNYRSLIFFGCGSGYMLSKGAAAMFAIHTDQKTVAFAGGEVMMDPPKYKELFREALVIVCSRSGETSEVIRSLESLRKLTDFRVLGILAQKDCTLKTCLDYSLDIPWAYDDSVCQTRTISNLYYSLTMLLAFYLDDIGLKESFGQFFKRQSEFLSILNKDCERIASEPWDNVTILADGEVCGIANEGGLAFTEICMLPGEYFNLLDYRHGPIVLADSKKLVIALLNPKEEEYQKQVIADLKAHQAFVITLGKKDQQFWESDYHISLDEISYFEVWGLPFINLCQLLAFHKALTCGHDPDVPEGLNPFIKF